MRRRDIRFSLGRILEVQEGPRATRKGYQRKLRGVLRRVQLWKKTSGSFFVQDKGGRERKWGFPEGYYKREIR